MVINGCNALFSNDKAQPDEEQPEEKVTIEDNTVNRPIVPVTIEDPDCAGEAYQVDYGEDDGGIEKYCIPKNTVSSDEFMDRYNTVSQEFGSVKFDDYISGDDLYDSATDVYDDVAVTLNRVEGPKDAVKRAFVFAEDNYESDWAQQVESVMATTIASFDPTLTHGEVTAITDKLFSKGLVPLTIVEHEYKGKKYYFSIDDMKAVDLSIIFYDD